jgi:multiple sugar transport system permease protein
MRRGSLLRREAIDGYLFISPWIVGFLVFTLGPMLFSLYASLCDWDMLHTPRFIGLANYATMFGHDFRFAKSLSVTLLYSAMALPLGVTASLGIAILLNQKVKGLTLFRAIYYIPAILPGVAVALMWKWIFNPESGAINLLLAKIGIQGPGWFTSPEWAVPALVIMSVWGAGAGMIIYLAGLQSVPTQLYEAAELDGAGAWGKFRNVTLPMISPTVFFNIVMGIIGSFQVFTTAFVITGGAGSPAYSTLFYVLYLYQKAFKYFSMGYACAMAWVLFVIILSLTLVVFVTSKRWVYYESERRG